MSDHVIKEFFYCCKWYLWMLQKILTVEENFESCMQPDMHVVVGISILKSDDMSYFYTERLM
jgi:hypothetical protein